MSETTKSIAEMVAEQPTIDNQALFDELWAITTELKEKVFARFELTRDPFSEKYDSYSSLDGSAQGFLSTWAGPEIDWLVYSYIGTPQISFSNMHLTISLGPHIQVPHFGFALGTAPDIFVYMDYLPRTDLLTDIDYFDTYYEPVNARYLELRNDDRFSSFVSQSSAMRLYQTVTSLCFMVKPSAETIGMIREAAHEMLDRWLGWVDAAEPVPQAKRAALAERDLLIRRTISDRDPANAIADKLFGQEMADELVNTLWGGTRTLPRAGQ